MRRVTSNENTEYPFLVPFTQYILPHGRIREEWLPVSNAAGKNADKFIRVGGVYECEVLTTGQISLTACIEKNGDKIDVEIEIIPNGPGIRDAAERLIERSLKHLP